MVTPSLNQGKFIDRTIRSVLEQGYPNLEYVIVDGGSSDETVEVIRRYEDRVNWWISEPDKGQADAINRGIANTSGNIVAYLNSDDYYLPGAFDAAVAALARSDRSWVAGAAMDLDEAGCPAGTPGTDAAGVIRPALPSAWEDTPRGRQWWLLTPWHVPQPAVFWRREMFTRHGLFRADMHYAFDAEFMIRLALAGEMPELLPDQNLAVRLHHSGAKSADASRWSPEVTLIVDQYSPVLTGKERRRLPIVRMLRDRSVSGNAIRAGLRGWRRMTHGAYHCRMALRRTVNLLLRTGGDLLEHVPERIRPPIRMRDRRQAIPAAGPRRVTGPLPQPIPVPTDDPAARGAALMGGKGPPDTRQRADSLVE